MSGLENWIEPLRRVFPVPASPDVNTAPAAAIALFLLFRFPAMGVVRVVSLFCFLLFNVIPAALLVFVYGMVGISSYGWRG